MFETNFLKAIIRDREGRLSDSGLNDLHQLAEKLPV